MELDAEGFAADDIVVNEPVAAGLQVGTHLGFVLVDVALEDVGLGHLGMYLVSVLALPTFLLARGLADVTRSFAAQYVNDRIGAVGRATVLSTMAMVSGLTVIPLQLGSGIISDVVSPLFVLAIAGGVLIFGLGTILFWEVPITD